MTRLRWMGSALVVIGATLSCSSILWAAQGGVITKSPDSSGQFCHLKFPAIKEDTLSWDRPVLKDPSEGDIIDFYGPCDYDPLGKTEIQRQRDDARRDRNRRDAEHD